MSKRILSKAIVATLATGASVLVMASQPAAAATTTIWGKQTSMGKFETEKTMLPKTGTITEVNVGTNATQFCIWSGMPTAQVVKCFRTDQDNWLNYQLPAGVGYFAIPDKKSLNAESRVEILVTY